MHVLVPPPRTSPARLSRLVCIEGLTKQSQNFNSTYPIHGVIDGNTSHDHYSSGHLHVGLFCWAPSLLGSGAFVQLRSPCTVVRLQGSKRRVLDGVA